MGSYCGSPCWIAAEDNGKVSFSNFGSCDDRTLLPKSAMYITPGDDSSVGRTEACAVVDST